MNSNRFPTRSTRRRWVAGLTVVAAALTACGGADAPDADVEIVADRDEDAVGPSATQPTRATTGPPTTATTDPTIGATTRPATTATPSTIAPSATTVAYPVSVEYAGLTWSIEDTRFVTEGDDDDVETFLHADLLIENSNPFGMRWPVDVVTLRRADETPLELDGVLDGGRRISVDARDLTRATLVFETDEEFDVSELSLAVAETDRIPATAAFAGGSIGDAPYPVNLTFEGTTKPLAMEYGLSSPGPFNEDALATIVALGGVVGVDGPGVRARTGYRLVQLDVRLDAAADAGNTSFQIVDDNYRLSVDGVATEPVALVEFIANSGTKIPTVDAGGSAEFILVFELPADTTASSAELLVITDEAFDQDAIPLTIPAMPPCCGE